MEVRANEFKEFSEALEEAKEVGVDINTASFGNYYLIEVGEHEIKLNLLSEVRCLIHGLKLGRERAGLYE